MKLPIFKRNLVHTLWINVEANLELYLSGDFNEFLSDHDFRGMQREVNGAFLKEEDFVNLRHESGGANDAFNAHIVFNAMENMTPNLATDERIWVAMTHTVGLEWVRKRWIKNNAKTEQKIQSIKSHFFARVDGSRGIHRNNAFSSLWWWAYLVKRNGDENFDNRLKTFLELTDLRAQILERPTASRVPEVFEAIMNCVSKKIENEPGTSFFTRKRDGDQETAPYRRWLARINLWGGGILVNALTVSELEAVFMQFMEEIEQS